MRVYGQWSGNERGVREDTTRCVVSLRPGTSMIPRQCRRRRGHGEGGLFCKQHAKKTADSVSIPRNEPAA